MAQLIEIVSTEAISATTTSGGRVRSGRDQRGFYLAITVFMYAVVLAGFWPYFSRLGADAAERPAAIHLHAIVFTGWMVLLGAQVGLVFARRSDLHRRLGRWGVGYGIGVIVMGLVATMVAPVVHVARSEWTLDQAAAFVILPIGDMVLFAWLFAAAVVNRRQPDVHKRYILLASVALMFAPAARLMESRGFAGILLVWMAPVLIAAAHDVWVRGRVHRAYYVGSAILLAGFARVFVMETEGWLRIGRALVRAATPIATLFG